MVYALTYFVRVLVDENQQSWVLMIPFVHLINGSKDVKTNEWRTREWWGTVEIHTGVHQFKASKPYEE